MKRLLVTICAATCLCFAGCDDDGGTFKPESSFHVPTSPEIVLQDLEAAYNEMNYEYFFPLILDDFIFVFNADDVKNFPDEIPPDGVWGKSDELMAHEHMLDTSYVPPGHPDHQVKRMMLEVGLSGSLKPTSLVGAPPGTLEGFVTFDLRVVTTGSLDYLVNSRPLFYFSPAGSSITAADTTVYWGIWQIVDAPFGQPTMTAGLPDPPSTESLPDRSSPGNDGDVDTPTPIESRSWAP